MVRNSGGLRGEGCALIEAGRTLPRLRVLSIGWVLHAVAALKSARATRLRQSKGSQAGHSRSKLRVCFPRRRFYEDPRLSGVSAGLAPDCHVHLKVWSHSAPITAGRSDSSFEHRPGFVRETDDCCTAPGRFRWGWPVLISGFRELSQSPPFPGSCRKDDNPSGAHQHCAFTPKDAEPPVLLWDSCAFSRNE